eukprot:11710293-Alexandrium_andersonii.AAC.1
MPRKPRRPPRQRTWHADGWATFGRQRLIWVLDNNTTVRLDELAAPSATLFGMAHYSSFCV